MSEIEMEEMEGMEEMDVYLLNSRFRRIRRGRCICRWRNGLVRCSRRGTALSLRSSASSWWPPAGACRRRCRAQGTSGPAPPVPLTMCWTGNVAGIATGPFRLRPFGAGNAIRPRAENDCSRNGEFFFLIFKPIT